MNWFFSSNKETQSLEQPLSAREHAVVLQRAWHQFHSISARISQHPEAGTGCACPHAILFAKGWRREKNPATAVRREQGPERQLPPCGAVNDRRRRQDGVATPPPVIAAPLPLRRACRAECYNGVHRHEIVIIGNGRNLSEMGGRIQFAMVARGRFVQRISQCVGGRCFFSSANRGRRPAAARERVCPRLTCGPGPRPRQ